MPITAKLSRQFYEKLGDEAANELVDWLNAVDQSYRQEFRQLFDSNFGRLEARNGQQFAELRAEMTVSLQRVEAGFGQQLGAIRVEMGRLETRLIRWMFGFWVGTWLAVAGTMFALQRLR